MSYELLGILLTVVIQGLYVAYRIGKFEEKLTSIEKKQDKHNSLIERTYSIDRDLAELYGIQTYRLNEAVKRNIKRFPSDFMFKLNDNEFKELIANCDRFKNLKHSSNFPYAFTEQGVAMLASVLNSETAISINIQIVRAFVQLRQYAIAQTNINQEIEELSKMLLLHIENTDNRFEKNEETIKQIIIVLNNLIEQPRETKKIGF